MPQPHKLYQMSIPEQPLTAFLDSWTPPENRPTLIRRSDPQNPAPVRIVVVDDEPMAMQAMAIMTLAKYDVSLSLFTSAVEAWRELNLANPDMLIVDDRMSGMNGEEIARGLVERNVSYPILVMSAYYEEDQVLGWCPDATNICLLSKPFTFAQVHAELEKHFEPAPVGNLADTNQ